MIEAYIIITLAICQCPIATICIIMTDQVRDVIVVLYCNAHVCLYIYTLYLDNLVSRYCMIVLVVLFYFCYC